MPAVRTDGGALVNDKAPGGKELLTTEQAQAQCDRCNADAEKLGIKTRYVVAAS